MLNLASTTRASWLPQALDHVPTILIDHAHCEKKAASTALSLLFKYPQHTALLKPLSELAREELSTLSSSWTSCRPATFPSAAWSRVPTPPGCTRRSVGAR